MTIRRLSRLGRQIHPDRSPVLYLLPALAFLAVFLVYPVGRLIHQAFHHNVLIAPWEARRFVGFANFVTLFTDPVYQRSFFITVTWTLLSVAGKTLIGFGAALLLQNPFPGRRVYLYALIVPWATPVVVGATAWRWLLHGHFGRLNGILLALGVIETPLPWLTRPLLAFISTAVVDMWVGIPFMTLIIMAGLQAVPTAIYDAAKVDGAEGWSLFRCVTFPMVRRVLLIATLLSTVWTFNSFMVIWPLTRGGPVGATETLVVRTFTTAFGAFNFGMAGALSTLIFVILLLVSFGYWCLLRRSHQGG